MYFTYSSEGSSIGDKKWALEELKPPHFENVGKTMYLQKNEL